MADVTCAGCWKRVCISGTKPASGIPRWLSSSSASATRSTSSISSKTLPLYKAAAEFVRRLVADGGTLLFVGIEARCARGDGGRGRPLRHAVRHAALARRHAHELQDDPPVDQALEDARGDHRARCERRVHEERAAEVRAREGQAREDARRHQEHGCAADGRVPRSTSGHEEIAVREARKLGIPVVAVVDTNCSPEGIDYPIPGNDDAMRAIQLYAEGIADAVIDGKASIPEVPTGRRRVRRARRERQAEGRGQGRQEAAAEETRSRHQGARRRRAPADGAGEAATPSRRRRGRTREPNRLE